MHTLIFIIGATATGKTYYIEHNYQNEKYEILNVYDYQQKAYDAADFKDSIPIGAEFWCLYQANEMLLKDIIDTLLVGKDVVVEQTFYKAKRRIAYIDEIRRKIDVEISVYVMNPSEQLWKEHLSKRNLKFENYKDKPAQIEQDTKEMYEQDAEEYYLNKKNKG